MIKRVVFVFVAFVSFASSLFAEMFFDFVGVSVVCLLMLVLLFIIVFLNVSVYIFICVLYDVVVSFFFVYVCAYIGVMCILFMFLYVCNVCIMFLWLLMFVGGFVLSLYMIIVFFDFVDVDVDDLCDVLFVLILLKIFFDDVCVWWLKYCGVLVCYGM